MKAKRALSLMSNYTVTGGSQWGIWDTAIDNNNIKPL